MGDELKKLNQQRWLHEGSLHRFAAIADYIGSLNDASGMTADARVLARTLATELRYVCIPKVRADYIKKRGEILECRKQQQS